MQSLDNNLERPLSDDISSSSSSSSEINEEKKCMICWDKIGEQLVKTTCQHTYCYNCISKWILINKYITKCPKCRSNFSSLYFSELNKCISLENILFYMNYDYKTMISIINNNNVPQNNMLINNIEVSEPHQILNINIPLNEHFIVHQNQSDNSCKLCSKKYMKYCGLIYFVVAIMTVILLHYYFNQI